jgi:hypothetical protein
MAIERCLMAALHVLNLYLDFLELAGACAVLQGFQLSHLQYKGVEHFQAYASNYFRQKQIQITVDRVHGKMSTAERWRKLNEFKAQDEGKMHRVDPNFTSFDPAV